MVQRYIIEEDIMLTKIIVRNFKRFGEVEIDPEIKEKLDALVRVAEAAEPAGLPD